MHVTNAQVQVKNNDDPNKEAIYTNTLHVLEPEIEKLKQLMQFQNESIAMFTEQVKLLSNGDKRNEIIPEGLIWCMIKLLDSFALLDALKNMKACLNNDFSCYKRYVNIDNLKCKDFNQ